MPAGMGIEMVRLFRVLDEVNALADRARLLRDRSTLDGFRAATSHMKTSPAFDGLHARSLAVASVRPSSVAPKLNVVLPQLALSALFAGSRTAIIVGLKLGQKLGLPVRLIALTGTLSPRRRRALREYLARDFGEFADGIDSIISARELPTTEVGEHDLWLATHWTTAHSLDVAARLHVVDPSNVVYLVQDYEPGFSPWSTDFAIARATYHAGFRLVVNSTPLRDYLFTSERIEVSDEAVFRPQLDLPRLERSAARRRQRRPSNPSVLFYARPDKPRNLYALGMSTLGLTMLNESLSGHDVIVRTAGGAHSLPSTGPLSKIQRLGKTSWDNYFAALADSDIVFSLQYSPHPSHPPLDAVVSGGWAVTNELSGTRRGLHDRLLAGDSDPQALSDVLGQAIQRVRDGEYCAPYSPELLEALGGDLDEVLDAVVSQVSR